MVFDTWSRRASRLISPQDTRFRANHNSTWMHVYCIFKWLKRITFPLRLPGSSTLQVSRLNTPSASASACCRRLPGSPSPSGSSPTTTSSPRWEWCSTVSDVSASLLLPNRNQLPPSNRSPGCLFVICHKIIIFIVFFNPTEHSHFPHFVDQQLFFLCNVIISWICVGCCGKENVILRSSITLL